MKEWLEGFYSDPALRDTLLRSFLPVFSSYVEAATGGPVAASFVQALAESYVDRHLGSSRAQLQEVVGGSDNPLADLSARFEEWEAKRPEKVAKNELIRSANAAQVQQMREAGVEKMIWRASGGACPFCNELDGVIISVNGTFFEPGDELIPEGVTAPIHFESTIGHPPVHQGCSCFVEAVTETEFDVNDFDDAARDWGAADAGSAPKVLEMGDAAGLSEELTQRLHDISVGWNEDSGSAYGIALREAALRRGATAADFTNDALRNAIIETQGMQDMVADADRLLDLSAAEVQRRFGTDGTVTLYRGLSFDQELPGMPGIGDDAIEAVMEQRPLSSWSMSRSEAFRFAEQKEVGYVLEMQVPISDVAGVAGTGLGNGVHGEVVLYGRPNQVARVLRTDPLP